MFEFEYKAKSQIRDTFVAALVQCGIASAKWIKSYHIKGPTELDFEKTDVQIMLEGEGDNHIILVHDANAKGQTRTKIDRQTIANGLSLLASNNPDFMEKIEQDRALTGAECRTYGEMLLRLCVYGD